MRSEDWTPSEVIAVVEDPELIDFGPDGKFRYTGFIRSVRVRVVLALDDPEFVVTIHRRRS